MKQNKYVVLKDTPGEWGVALGYVEYHRHLCNTEELAHGLVDGGGMWRIDHNDKNILFYGKSDDFGYPKHIAEALSACFNGIKDQIADLLYTMDGKDYDLTEYTITYADEGINTMLDLDPDKVHLVTPRYGGIYGGGNYEIKSYGAIPTGTAGLYGSPYTMPSYKPKGVPKIKPKNYDKKKKAKRKAQKQSRRHK